MLDVVPPHGAAFSCCLCFFSISIYIYNIIYIKLQPLEYMEGVLYFVLQLFVTFPALFMNYEYSLAEFDNLH